MRGAALMIYCIALGWYVRASGLDEDLAALAREGYDLAVLHTAKVIRAADARGELDEPAAGQVAA